MRDFFCASMSKPGTVSGLSHDVSFGNFGRDGYTSEVGRTSFQ